MPDVDRNVVAFDADATLSSQMHALTSTGGLAWAMATPVYNFAGWTRGGVAEWTAVPCVAGGGWRPLRQFWAAVSATDADDAEVADVAIPVACGYMLFDEPGSAHVRVFDALARQ